MRDSPARVLHLIDTSGPGGAETVLDTIVSHLPPGCWRSRVLVRERDWLTERLNGRGIDWRLVRSDRAFDVPYVRALVRELREFRPHVIHAHLLTSGVYGTLASAFSTRVPLVCTLHGMPDINAKRPLLQAKARLLSRSSNRIVYVSHALRRDLEPVLGVPTGRGAVIHNGLPFGEAPVTGSERRDAGAAEGQILLLAVGNVRPAKDYPNLLRAAAIVCEKRPEVRFAIAGGADGHEELFGDIRAMTLELGLSERVRFLGFRSDSTALISACDVFVSSSATEGLPLATLEALALGRPAVLTRVGGVPEITGDVLGYALVRPGDAAALADAILRSLDQPARAVDVARRTAASVRSRFGVERMISAYESVYETLVQLYPEARGSW